MQNYACRVQCYKIAAWHTGIGFTYAHAGVDDIRRPSVTDAQQPSYFAQLVKRNPSNSMCISDQEKERGNLRGNATEPQRQIIHMKSMQQQKKLIKPSSTCHSYRVLSCRYVSAPPRAYNLCASKAPSREPAPFNCTHDVVVPLATIQNTIQKYPASPSQGECAE